MFGGSADGGDGVDDFAADGGGQRLQSFRFLQRSPGRFHAVADGFRSQGRAALRFLRRPGRFFRASGNLIHRPFQFFNRRGGFVDAAGKLGGGRGDALGRLLLLRHGAGAAAFGLGLALNLLFLADRFGCAVIIGDSDGPVLHFFHQCHDVLQQCSLGVEKQQLEIAKFSRIPARTAADPGFRLTRRGSGLLPRSPRHRAVG